MAVYCEVFPRQGATPCQLQELGLALQRWYARESREYGIALYTNGEGAKALRDGRLPPARAPRRKGRQFPAVPLAVRAGRTYDRRTVIESLRKDIRPDLVEDVLIDGRSWRD